jgi:hypothetical protein
VAKKCRRGPSHLRPLWFRETARPDLREQAELSTDRKANTPEPIRVELPAKACAMPVAPSRSLHRQLTPAMGELKECAVLSVQNSP